MNTPWRRNPGIRILVPVGNRGDGLRFATLAQPVFFFCRVKVRADLEIRILNGVLRGSTEVWKRLPSAHGPQKLLPCFTSRPMKKVTLTFLSSAFASLIFAAEPSAPSQVHLLDRTRIQTNAPPNYPVSIGYDLTNRVPLRYDYVVAKRPTRSSINQEREK